MRNAIIKIAVFVMLMLSCIGFSADGDIATSGDGSSDRPYLIAGATDWGIFANVANQETYWAEGKYTELGADVDFSGGSVTVIAGSDADTYEYDGHFDGKGYKIINVAIDVNSDVNATALFGHTSSTAVIQNLTVVNAIVSGDTSDAGSTYTAVIVGENAGGAVVQGCTVIDCLVSITQNIDQLGYLGMIVGANHGTVDDCKVIGGVASGDNTAATTGTKKLLIGGIVGHCPTGGIVSNSTSTVTITDVAAATTDAIGVGGVAGGFALDAGIVSNCQWRGIIDYDFGTLSAATDEVVQVGGIVGWTSQPDFTDCSSEGIIKVSVAGGGAGDSVFVGGGVGHGAYTASAPTAAGQFTRCSANINTFIYNAGSAVENYGGFGAYTNDVSFTDCFSKGAVFVIGASPISDVSSLSLCGGFLGYTRPWDYTVLITNCFSSVQNADGAFIENAASTDPTCVNCFWDTDNSGTADDAIAGTTPKTCAEMLTKSTFLGWSNFNVKTGYYPILQWQTYPLSSVQGTGSGSAGVLSGGSGLMGN